MNHATDLEKQLAALQAENQRLRSTLDEQARLASVGMMVSAIAHQWLQPLNALWVSAQHLACICEEESTPATCIRGNVSQIMEYLRFMAQTVEDFRDFTSPGAGGECFAPQQAIEITLGMLKNLLLQHQVDVRLHGEPNMNIRGSAGEFRHVVIILLNNAIDVFRERATPHPVIHITISGQQQFISIEFRDNGGGIDPDLLPSRLFEPFTSTKERGMGIGLHLARRIVEEKLQGTLRAENIPGTGARLLLWIPQPSTTTGNLKDEL
ncbi:ATP-binding region ATPase domain protein [Desulfurispirillum indicum S5]|uniref:histidine kinase n=1 Tax=Desulfurispirillum indicum (strain ATCC BAA-1389 / DSM 22839 / S5) TaxID=653733 RepID=E6W2J7_DESIS|nr:ATP-binding protein [Desulfurispirillum indicum]ADU66747.1 ATP-binding region ATPase domain protein [Desulfurispirillum indicum S5]